jgi:RNA polymerase sigma-54 factor
MMLAARQDQRQSQTLTVRQLQGIAVLRLTNEGLADFLQRRAQDNPLLRLRMPATAGHTEPPETAAEGGLYDHILPQLPLILHSPRDRALALALVEALDGNGWLDRPLAEIARDRPPAEAEAVLTRLQQGIEPTGIFARGLADCLRLQAAEQGLLIPAMQALLDRLPLLAAGGAEAVARAAALPLAHIEEAARRLRRLDPRPGLAFGGAPAPLQEPDVLVRRQGAGWRVELNRATLPALTILPGDGPALRPARAEAEWLAQVVERRNRTVLAVTRAVLRRQAGFLDHGPQALRRLTRTEIAQELGLHDSTVGRVARDLLVETPQGLRSLCSLFDASAGGAETGESATAIRHRLAQLVAAEPPALPRSDAELARLLAAEGLTVARRSVARYREALQIPPRALRRRAQAPARR